MTSSTKPEVHNASHSRQRRTEPRLQVTCTVNLVKFGHVVFEIRERTDKQTDKQTHRHADHDTPHLYMSEATTQKRDVNVLYCIVCT